MKIADFGCGVGTVTSLFAEMVGPRGRVMALDLSPAQLDLARARMAKAGHTNVDFLQADATASGLPSESFDFVYCRFFLLHLLQPLKGLAEMKRVLRPGGTIFVEDADLTTGYTIPPSAIERFGDLCPRLDASIS